MTTTYVDMFQIFREEFKNSKLWKDMEKNVEDSPWHREANTAVHSDMVVEQYMKHAKQVGITTDNIAWLIGALSALFHDVGKPMSRVEMFKPERGKYFAYHGHEQTSARLMEDYFMSHPEHFDTLGISLEHLYYALWMVENHLPFGIVNPNKLKALRVAVEAMEKSLNAYKLFACVLAGDQNGRISDNQQEKLTRANDWVDNFYKINSYKHLRNKKKTVILLVGTSGAGKTTKSLYTDSVRFSNDDARVEYALQQKVIKAENDPIENYRIAWSYCNDAKGFNTYAQKLLNEKLDALTNDEASTLVIDMTNLSVKARRKFVDFAHRRDFNVVAKVFLISIDELMERAKKRTDHKVPFEAIKRQYFCMQFPDVGEVDSVEVYTSSKHFE